jgi:RNA methyltransferase, TrmH family
LSKITQSEKKMLRTLLTKKGREEAGQFTAEGVRLLEESLRHCYFPVELFYVSSQLDPRGTILLERFKKAGVACREVSAPEMRQISDTAANQGILAHFNVGHSDLAKFNDNKYKRVLILDNISDPGNAGTILRSALAFGFNSAIFTENSVEPFNPKVVRSSAGAIFGLGLFSLAEAEIAEIINGGAYKLLAADIKGEVLNNIDQRLSPTDKILLAIGSEALGVSQFINKLCDIRLRISHTDNVESLNAAVAGSIIMKEIYYSDIGYKK